MIFSGDSIEDQHKRRFSLVFFFCLSYKPSRLFLKIILCQGQGHIFTFDPASRGPAFSDWYFFSFHATPIKL